MKSRIHREHANGAHIRGGSFLAPKLARTLGSDERRFLVWGCLSFVVVYVLKQGLQS
ncbi:hypothetical protein B0G80_4646 [Paraburkholderia sp. BL6669N2]|nr:hypothetical protein B0G80_4646 [Paraburkholderia sp. BL6669N2]